MLVPAGGSLVRAHRRVLGILVAGLLAAGVFLGVNVAGSAGSARLGLAVRPFDAWYLDAPAPHVALQPFDNWFDDHH